VGLEAGLDESGKSDTPPGFELQNVQSLACRYTEYAVPATYQTNDFDSICVFLIMLSPSPLSPPPTPKFPQALAMTSCAAVKNFCDLRDLGVLFQ
jgi:hypothetical protein